MTIYAKVAKILDEYRILLTAGSADGVKQGMPFIIYEEGEEILHPDTGESLGKMENVKGRVVIEHVQERLSLASAPAVEGEDPESTVLSARLARSDPLARPGKLREKLYIRAHEAEGWTPPGAITVGDSARSIEEEVSQSAT